VGQQGAAQGAVWFLDTGLNRWFIEGDWSHEELTRDDIESELAGERNPLKQIWSILEKIKSPVVDFENFSFLKTELSTSPQVLSQIQNSRGIYWAGLVFLLFLAIPVTYLVFWRDTLYSHEGWIHLFGFRFFRKKATLSQVDSPSTPESAEGQW
jgi:hypothetical protein